ncbi:hypothetical protein GCM10010499_11670 [Streptomyces thermoviolaceus subsp. apingens]|nr:hypothetical protein GCM10010499_11670 [Streptomyces thermoviolaceus subsp. apingens]
MLRDQAGGRLEQSGTIASGVRTQAGPVGSGAERDQHLRSVQRFLGLGARRQRCGHVHSVKHPGPNWTVVRFIW